MNVSDNTNSAEHLSELESGAYAMIRGIKALRDEFMGKLDDILRFQDILANSIESIATRVTAIEKKSVNRAVDIVKEELSFSPKHTPNRIPDKSATELYTQKSAQGRKHRVSGFDTPKSAKGQRVSSWKDFTNDIKEEEESDIDLEYIPSLAAPKSETKSVKKQRKLKMDLSTQLLARKTSTQVEEAEKRNKRAVKRIVAKERRQFEHSPADEGDFSRNLQRRSAKKKKSKFKPMRTDLLPSLPPTEEECV
ncbi:hypothetical protein PCE1_003509 [Barthelona sp. PCE]